MKKEKRDYLTEHKLYFGKETVVPLSKVVKDTILKINYNDDWKFVYVLNPRWEDKLHGIDLRLIERDNLMNVVKFIHILTEKSLYQKHIKHQPENGYYAYRTYWIREIGKVYSIDYEMPAE